MKHCFYGILISGTAFAYHSAQATPPIHLHNELVLKTLYFDRDYETNTTANSSSLTQGFLYRGDWSVQLDSQLQLHLMPSLQYAYRLSPDQHSSDQVIPFDQTTRSQAQDYSKYGLGLGIRYQNIHFNAGEIIPDSPLTPQVDTHQLRVNYKGGEFKYQLQGHEIELGLINRYSPRNEEGYRKLAILNQESDGLYFAQWTTKTSKYTWKFYNGYLIDLLNQSYLALDYQWNPQHTTKFRAFHHKNVGQAKLGEYHNTSIGAMHFIKYGNVMTGLGYQENFGSEGIPKLDGIPIPHMMNWTLGAFTKAHEQSYHFMISYDLKNYVQGLKLTYKYIYGDAFKTNQQNDFEQESDVLVQYDLHAWIKHLKFLYLYINYDTKYGKSLDEQRMMLHYSVKF